MKPLILISNDDGYQAPGINLLASIASEFAQVVVVAPEGNASAKSMSLTVTTPVTLRKVSDQPNIQVFACSGTPVDCVKVGLEHCCPRNPSLVLAGINHGSNAAINVVYSGTMGAALEAAICGYPSVGFSLLSHSHEVNCDDVVTHIRNIVAMALNQLQPGVSLNVNIPCRDHVAFAEGVKVCRPAKSWWADCYKPIEGDCTKGSYQLTGHLASEQLTPDTDLYLLNQGYITIVPCHPNLYDEGFIHQFSSTVESNL